MLYYFCYFHLKDVETDCDSTGRTVHTGDDVMEQDNTVLASEVTIDNEDVAVLSNDEAVLSLDSDETDSGNDENAEYVNFGTMPEGLIMQLVGEVKFMLIIISYKAGNLHQLAYCFSTV